MHISLSNLFLLFYHDDTVDVGEKWQVVNTIYLNVNDNHWWDLMGWISLEPCDLCFIKITINKGLNKKLINKLNSLCLL